MADYRRNHRRFAVGGNDAYYRDPRDEEIDRLRQRLREVELQSEGRWGDLDDSERTESGVYDGDRADYRNSFGRPYHVRQDSPPARDPLRNLGFRMEIPEFEGGVPPDEFIDWIHTVERVFDVKEVPDYLKVKLVALKLRKHASLWWEHLKKKRHQEGKHKVDTWDKMKRLLQKKFLPVNHRQDAFLEYHSFKQGSLTVDEFILEFERLRLRCGADEEDEQVIAHFLGSLRSDIADVVHLHQYYSFDDVCRLAHRVEKQNKSRSRYTPARPMASRPNPLATGLSSSAQQRDTVPPVTAPASNPNMGTTRCYKCGGLGHLKRECPNKQVVALVEDKEPVYDTYLPTDDEFQDAEILYPDRGEALISQRVLSASMAKEDDDTTWLRHKPLCVT